MSSRSLRDGGVIPAHPLALTEDLRIDERHQRALTRYYLASGAAGIAVAVHTTQFPLHGEHAHLLPRVLSLAAEEVAASGREGVAMIAGVMGETASAVAEAQLAAERGYHAVLLVPRSDDSEDGELRRAAEVGRILPVIGFYLQPAVGGRRFTQDYWTRLADQESTVAVKCAPFERYATLSLLRGVAASDRAHEVALYTGNDDHILHDLGASFPVGAGHERVHFAGGLLGHWSYWTSRAVEHLDVATRARSGDASARALLDALAPEVTDANGAVFDAINRFRGSIAGVHEVLRRHGLMQGTWTLSSDEALSPGQRHEIDRIWASYPHLRDDEFINTHREEWLR